MFKLHRTIRRGQMTHIYKAAGIIVRDKKLLVVRSKGKDIFFAPGGKLEENETYEQALVRELQEELSMEIDERHYEHFGVFTAEADDKPGVILHMMTFFIKNYGGPLQASSEIEELAWVDAANTNGISIGSIFRHEVLPRLAAQGLVE